MRGMHLACLCTCQHTTDAWKVNWLSSTIAGSIYTHDNTTVYHKGTDICVRNSTSKLRIATLKDEAEGNLSADATPTAIQHNLI